MPNIWSPRAWSVLALLVGGTRAAGTTAGAPAGAPAGTTTGAGASGGAAGAVPPPSTAEVNNDLFASYILICLASIVVVLTIYRIIISSVRYLRTVTCLSNETQRFFMQPNALYAQVKEHLIYAPLFRKRHNKELHLIHGWGLGILPTRFQSIFLTGVIGMNVALCTVGIEWDQITSQNALNHLRNRTGTLAVVNLIPLVIMAGRNNPLIKIVNVSFDTWNMMHRWFGRIVVAEIITHFVVWTVKTVQATGWASVAQSFQTNKTNRMGLMAVCGAVFIILQSTALVRHAFYEVFLHMHIATIIFVIVTIWMHLEGYPEQVYLKVVIVCWALERLFRCSILIYRNIGSGGTRAIVEALPGDAVRVSIKMARPWNFRPGQHMFITMPSVGLWTSHPFSVAWSSTDENVDGEKGLAMTRQDVLRNEKITVSAVIRRRDGFTHKLFKKAEASPEGRIVVSALAEGPYGAHYSLHSYGTVLMFAGGVGITHQVPYVRDLVTGFANGTVATRRVLLVWVIQSPEHLEWIRPWMTSILALDRRRDILRIQLFVTRPRSTKEIHSPSATVQMFPGRPNVDTLIGLESESQIGAMAVSVCGTGGLADDVRKAVRRRQGLRNIDFVEEAFSW